MGEPDTYFVLKINVLLPDQKEDLQNLMMDEISSESTLEKFEAVAKNFFSAVAGEDLEVFIDMDYA